MTVFVIDPSNISEERAHAALIPSELDQAQRFHFKKDATHWRACRCALREILAGSLRIEPAEVRLQFGDFGKPLLQTPLEDLHFNLSHCHDLALVVLCHVGSVGIDVESADRAPSLIGCESAFCHLSEIAQLPDAPPQRAEMLLNLWTKKEALLKAIGTGMSLAPQSVSLAAGQEDLSADLRLSSLHCHRLHHPLLDDHIAHLAVPKTVKQSDIAILSH